MGSKPLKVENLRALHAKLVQQSGFCSTCPAVQEHKAVGQGHLIECFDNFAAVAFVPALKKLHTPADLIKDCCKRV